MSGDESNSGARLLPCIPCAVTPGGTTRVAGEPTLYEVGSSGCIRPWIPESTPVVASAASTPKGRRKHASGADGTTKRSRRALGDEEIFKILEDSGSECEMEREEECEVECAADVDNSVDNNFKLLRGAARQLREYLTNEGGVSDDERDERADIECESIEENERVFVEENADVADEICMNVVDESMNESVIIENMCTNEVDTNFIWSEDFRSFTGQMESYLRVPGPTFSSQDPADIFCKIWDREFMESLVRETNKYAWETISELSDPDSGNSIPKYLDSWADVTVEELYRYFAVLILLSFCHHSKIHEYWDTGILGMPAFRAIMSRNRFNLINKFLHFVSNKDLLHRGHARKIEKVAPVVEHCNRKFSELYTPSQHLSLSESLLLWKGRLSWKQCIRSKAARFGIKSFELCEARTGYLLQYRLYTGKNDDIHPEPLHEFQSHTAKVVLDLMEGFLDVGHVIVMDNWHNQLSLTRYLKTRHTDVLGTLNRRRKGVPDSIKSLIPNRVKRGMTVVRHSGDIALVAWKDVKLVTVMSTYHQHEIVAGTRAGQAVQKPVVVEEYNRYMGGVDLKDQKLSMFLMEWKGNLKWYMKVFRRLLNTSLLNAYIIYTRNPMYQVYSHREFRKKVAEGILIRYPHESSLPSRVSNTSESQNLRLQPGQHFPIFTEAATTGKAKHKQLRCVRCTALKKRVCVTIMCQLCRVPLCVGQCWKDYHTLENLL